jgi:hypothetical protein
VFAAGTLLIVEFVRIGAITFLYLLSIFGWGDLLWGRFSGSKDDFTDYLITRLFVGCPGHDRVDSLPKGGVVRSPDFLLPFPLIGRFRVFSGAGRVPLLEQEGWTRHQEKCREASN